MGRRLTLLLLLTGCASVPSPQPAERPNIVFILADDLGWTDLGCFGSTYYRTPNLDRLRAEGLKFTNAYSNGPNCAPTRACLMSGQYPPRHGIYTVGSGARGQAKHRKLVPVENRTVLDPSVRTPAEVLRDAGYATAHFGKWHLGNPPAGPRDQGFDLNVGGDHRGHPPTYFSPYRNKELKDGPKGEYLTDRLTDEALAFIEASRERPFFVYLPHYAVHTPIQGKKEIAAKYADRKPSGGHRNPVYAAMIESVDESVGRILAKLDELKLTRKTVVIFSSDNGGLGGYAAAGVAGARDVTSNAPLRGGKGMLYEGGVRVAQLARWPGVIRPGSVCDEPVVTLDLYPTFLDLAGARPPADQPLDGVSLAPILKSSGGVRLEREAIFWHFPGYLQASARQGTWRTTPAGSIRSGSWKLIEFFETGKVELYNLAEDVGESTDLASSNPSKAEALKKKLAAWRKSISAPMPRAK